MPELRSKVLIPAEARLAHTRFIGGGVYLGSIEVQCDHVGGPFSFTVGIKAREPLTRKEIFDAAIKQLTGK